MTLFCDELNETFANEQTLDNFNQEITLLMQDPRQQLPSYNNELNGLVTENIKLKHRLSILEKEISNHRSNALRAGENVPVISHLTQLFQKAVFEVFPKLDAIQLTITTSSNARFGDYQFNSAMAISQRLKNLNESLSPKDVSAKILQHLGASNVALKYEISGPGYINIYLNRAYVVNMIRAILKYGVTAPNVDKKRIIIDFSSPNIAKEMHVGHLRSTIIGDSIARLLEFYGHNVLRLNHIGDWGTQFGMLIVHLQDRFPTFTQDVPHINDLQQFYKESKMRFDEEEVFKQRAYDAVVKLQSNDPEHIKAWNIICAVSRKEFHIIYDRLDVRILERGESFYQSRMEQLVVMFEAKGYLKDDNGRKIMWGMKANTGIPLTVVKTGGGFTYDTSDMAAIKQRIEEENSDWIIYVTDAGQATHFRTIFDCATKAGIIDPSKHRIDHVGFGLVLGEDGKKFKSRSGDTVKLADLLNEGLKRSLDKLHEKGRDAALSEEELGAAQRSIAYGCVKYADLSHNRNLDYTFSFDKMLDDKGNTAVYMLYALARIKSIARNCGSQYKERLSTLVDKTTFEFSHNKEWTLAKTLIKFADIMDDICKDLYLHRLCEYVYEVSTAFSEFYSNCYCIEKTKEGVTTIHDDRILLSEATAIVLEKCFYILGLKPIEKI